MEQIIVGVRDKNKAKMLSNLLKSLDFVDFVTMASDEGNKEELSSQEKDEEFLSFAGLWEGRDINLVSIRQNAWPKDP